MTMDAGTRSKPKPRTQWMRNLRRLSPLGIGAAIVLLLALLISLFPGLFTEGAPNVMNMVERLQPPSFRHPFGTDELGRDLYTRSMFGIRLSLGAAVSVVLLSALIGVPFGLIAGFAGGRTDAILMRFADILIAFPSLIMAMAIVTVLSPGLVNAMIALALVWWPHYARLVRGQTLQVREMPFVEAAGALGMRRFRILWRHVFPNTLSPILVKMSLDVSLAILATASFSFLGIGATPPSPELGSLVTQGRNYFLEAWWYTTFPGLVILLLSLAFNVVADDVRDVLDPTLRY